MTADTQLAGRARRTKADEAMNAILRYIKANDLKMGERLPSEREMTEMFSIGRASIREAIKVLCMMNILEVHPQGGTFISTFSANSSYDQFRLFLQSGHINMEEIFETRLILETECIALAAKNITDEQLERVCRACGLDKFVHSLPQSFDTVLSESTSISAGQKQLLTIARAMLQNAPMLILDEATSSVDTRTELLIQRAMDRLTAGRTSFVIAHRLSTIKNADLILVMKDGDVIESGTHETLMQKGGFYAELYNSQFEQAS